MDFVIASMGAVLALAFVVAGTLKLLNPPAFAQTLMSFGLPRLFASPLSVALPIAELTVGGLVCVSAYIGGVSAAALLAIFSAVIVINLVIGNRPECQCFGQLNSKPIGKDTLFRNGILIVAAIAVALRGYPGHSFLWQALAHTFGIKIGVTLAASMVFAIQSWIMLHLIRQHGRIAARVEAIEGRFLISPEVHRTLSAKAPGPQIGSLAPEFDLPGPAGTTVSLAKLREPGRTVLLVFSDPTCRACKELAPRIAQWRTELSEFLTVAVLTRKDKGGKLNVPEAESVITLFQGENEVSSLYEATFTPSALLVRASGEIWSPLAVGNEAIAQLIEHFRERHSYDVPRDGLSPSLKGSSQSQTGAVVGQGAPSFKLPDLDGRIADSSEFSGRPALFLFWNPRCGFCMKMVPVLRRWEIEMAHDLPRIVLIASGTADQNRALGLRTRILLDPSFRIGSMFGATGTPSAALVDSDGRIVSRAVIGADNIQSLIWTAPGFVARS